MANNNRLCATPRVEVPARLADEVAATGVSGCWVTETGIDELTGAKGAYLLVLRLGEAIEIGSLRATPRRLPAGWYVYAGSAWGSGGLRARVRRHFLRAKTVYWHIDRLTVKATELAALAVADGHECALAGKLLESGRFRVAARGFGSTDCRLCESHLLVAAS